MKKGFTLTELLVVIAIIGILSVIAVPSIMLINKNINKRNYNNKVDLIVSTAELYATNKPEIFNGHLEVKVYVADLINADYLKIEESSGEDCTKTKVNRDGSEEEVTTKGCIINPVDKTSMNGDYVLLKNETVGVVASFNGKTDSTDNKELVKIICDKFKNGTFIGKYDESDEARCECEYDSTGNITGLIAVKPNSMKGTKVEACIISGYEKNNYLYYDNKYWRVMGLYDLSNSDKGSHGIVPKLITDDGIETE